MPYGILTVIAIGKVHAIFGPLAYSMYLPLATYMILAMYTPSLVCSHAFFGVLAVLDLGVFVLLILALRGMVVIAS
jgi:hypothetical protein